MAKCLYSGARIPVDARKGERQTITCNVCTREVVVIMYDRRGIQGVARVEDHQEKKPWSPLNFGRKDPQR